MMPLVGLRHRIAFSSSTWASLDLEQETEIPLSRQHPGSFLYTRKNHIHEGIDLYCLPDQDVCAINNGIVIDIIPFTGAIAGTPFWENTYGLVVEDLRGVWIYGEIQPLPNIQIGYQLVEGELLGKVVKVLKNNKGRPTSMLHLERYCRGTHASIGVLPLGSAVPKHLLNPVEELLRLNTTEMFTGLTRLKRVSTQVGLKTQVQYSFNPSFYKGYPVKATKYAETRTLLQVAIRYLGTYRDIN